MLPGLGALSLGTPTGAQDDVVTEIRDEQREALHKAWEVAEEEHEEEEALGPQLEELRAKEQALRETYRSEKRAGAVRKEVFDNEDLVKEVLMALDDGDDVYDVCKTVARWCSLNKARRAACDDKFYLDLIKRIWGKVPYDRDHYLSGSVPWHYTFSELCGTEHAFRKGIRVLPDETEPWLKHSKRIVLAAIAASSTSLESTTHYKVLSHASDELRDDEDVVRAAVAKDPRAIQFASPRLQALINPLRPTFYWPMGRPNSASPRAPAEMEFWNRWGDAVLRILLHSSWDELTVKKIWIQLANDYPEVGLDYFRVTHRMDLKRLINWLILHIRENIRLGSL